jgi:ADP-ribosyl-[dinitrogen reductase] hydrolase
VSLAAARAAGDLLRGDFHRSFGPRGHGDKAEADVEAERLIRERLLTAFPGWGYLGEETGAVAGRPGAPVWLVDPNDGTRDFLEGRRGSSVSIGLVQEGRPVLGVVHPFAYPDDDGDMFAWAFGHGAARRRGAEVGPSLPTTLGPNDVVLVSSGGDRSPEANLRCSAPARFRALPSIAHRLALVAAGEAAATVSVFAPCAWDYAAGHALLRGVGGVLLDETGAEVGYAEDGRSFTRCAFAGSRAVASQLVTRRWPDVLTAPRLDPGPVRLQRGGAVADAGRLSRAQGCLLGQVGGDSLGGLVEFKGPGEIEADWPGGPRDLCDGGTWGLLAGQPTDDSEMALALARSIVEHEGLDAEAVLDAYREWRDSRPFDMGATTRAGLDGRPNAASQANGSLMRASPLAVLAHALPPDQAAALARQDSALTHPSPVCGDAAAAFVVAAAHAIREGDGPRAAHAAALAWAETAGAEPAVVERLRRAAREPPSPAECCGAKQGWVLLALHVAFHALLHFEGPGEGVVWGVRLGGDTDTNAAITGALLGAVHGREAVPAQWRRMVLSCRALGPAAGRPRPPRYWPTDVLELAERLLLAGRPTGP